MPSRVLLGQRILKYRVGLSIENFYPGKGGSHDDASVGTWTLETELIVESEKDPARASIRIVRARSDYTSPLPATLEGFSLGFVIDRQGRPAGFDVEPSGRGLPERNFTRGLVHLHLPPVLARDDPEGEFDLAARDTIRGTVQTGDRTDPPPQGSPLRDVYPATLRWSDLRIEGGAVDGDIGVLDLQHAKPEFHGPHSVDQTFLSVHALAEDGFPAAGVSRFSRVTRPGSVAPDGLIIAGWIVRAEFIDSDLLRALRDRVAGRARSIARELEATSPPPDDHASAASRYPLARFTIRTGTMADIEQELLGISRRQGEGDSARMLEQMGEDSRSDPGLADRLLRIAQDEGDLMVRRLAILALGAIRRSDIRQALLDIAETEEYPLDLRGLALRSAFMRVADERGWERGIGIGGDVLVAAIGPTEDEAAIGRVMALADSQDVPPELKKDVLWVLSVTQRLQPEGRDNAASKRLRRLYEEDPTARKSVLAALETFPSKENFQFIESVYRAEPDQHLRREALSGLTTIHIKDPGLREWVNDRLLRLVEGAPTRTERSKLLRQITKTPRVAGKVLDLAREELLRPPAAGEAAFEEQAARNELIGTISSVGRHPEFRERSRAILLEARPRLEHDPLLLEHVDHVLGRIPEDR